eukprot:357906-Chlamydomonas_euryale.AAC.1
MRRHKQEGDDGRLRGEGEDGRFGGGRAQYRQEARTARRKASELYGHTPALRRDVEACAAVLRMR